MIDPENATYTAAEVKVLTEAALRLGRKEALEELRVIQRGEYFALAYGPLYRSREGASRALDAILDIGKGDPTT